MALGPLQRAHAPSRWTNAHPGRKYLQDDSYGRRVSHQLPATSIPGVPVRIAMMSIRPMDNPHRWGAVVSTVGVVPHTSLAVGLDLSGKGQIVLKIFHEFYRHVAVYVADTWRMVPQDPPKGAIKEAVVCCWKLYEETGRHRRSARGQQWYAGPA